MNQNHESNSVKQLNNYCQICRKYFTQLVPNIVAKYSMNFSVRERLCMLQVILIMFLVMSLYNSFCSQGGVFLYRALAPMYRVRALIPSIQSSVPPPPPGHDQCTGPPSPQQHIPTCSLCSHNLVVGIRLKYLLVQCYKTRLYILAIIRCIMFPSSQCKASTFPPFCA